ncbi:MAG TPA: peptidoglycan DD-metalloendopeptidase family protein [Candidatus Limnocylindrales bacterium]
MSKILERLASRGKTQPDAKSASGAFDPLAPIRSLAADVARLDGVGRLVPIGVCVLLVVAALVSSLAQVAPASALTAASATPAPQVNAAAPVVWYGAGDGPNAPDVSDIYLGDGTIPNTLQNPGVGTDASALLKSYTVVARDTLGAIAGKFGLATTTIYWANKSTLPNPSSLHVGQQLLIPPMDGLLVKAGAKDTLDSLATKYSVTAQDIIDTNNLPETKVIVGQALLIPGVSGGPMPKSSSSSSGSNSNSSSNSSSGSNSSSSSGSSSGSSSRGWTWPVGGGNYVSQYYWSGHHAIDIAAQQGTPVYAAVGGTVVMAGWRSVTGGGNVIWVMDGTKLYTTYNHLSYVGVRNGQQIRAGQRIGSIGMTGVATGPHLHFEVWLGPPWALGSNADAVNPCFYLAGC